MDILLHGGHPHSESAGGASPEVLFVLAVGLVAAVLLLQFLLDRYLEADR